MGYFVFLLLTGLVAGCSASAPPSASAVGERSMGRPLVFNVDSDGEELLLIVRQLTKKAVVVDDDTQALVQCTRIALDGGDGLTTDDVVRLISRALREHGIVLAPDGDGFRVSKVAAAAPCSR